MTGMLLHGYIRPLYIGMFYATEAVYIVGFTVEWPSRIYSVFYYTPWSVLLPF